GLMQPERELDDVGNAFAGHALAALILESIDIAARCKKPLLEMLDTNDTKMLGSNRLAVPPHRSQQLGDAFAIDLIDPEELRQRLVRTTYLGKYLAPNGSPRKPAKLGNERSHRAMPPEIAISRHVRSQITLQP